MEGRGFAALPDRNAGKAELVRLAGGQSGRDHLRAGAEARAYQGSDPGIDRQAPRRGGRCREREGQDGRARRPHRPRRGHRLPRGGADRAGGSMNLTAIVAEILRGYALPARGFHGVVHWARVLENGLRLAESTGANAAVVQLFAVFHDSRRENEGTDPAHGRRGANLAAELRGRLFELPDADFELLYRACEWHTEGRTDPDLTVQTCWDA